MLNFPLGLTHEYPCSYIAQTSARSLMAMNESVLSPALYEALLEKGFRRSGNTVYRPWCRSCGQCIAARIPVADFKPNRSQRRIQRANRDLRLNWRPGCFNADHYDLYQRYQLGRHPDGDMAQSSFEQAEDFLLAQWNEVYFLEMYLQNRLLAVAVTDCHPYSLSAVYTFYDPEFPRRSLGSFAILEQLRIAREQHLDHLYLGYWIPGSRKMAYKGNFLPLQVRLPQHSLSDEHWQTLPGRQEKEAFLCTTLQQHKIRRD